MMAIEERRRFGELGNGGIIVVEDLVTEFISERNYKTVASVERGAVS